MEYTQKQLENDLNHVLQQNQKIVDLMFVNKEYYAKDFPKILTESKQNRVDTLPSKEIKENIFIANLYRITPLKDVKDNDLVIYIRALDDQNNLWLSTFCFGSAGFLDDTDNYARRLFYSDLFVVDPMFLKESDPQTREQIKASFNLD